MDTTISKDAKPLCFVVMGYEKKTDPVTSKVYDLDKSYRSIIKRGAEAAGFEVVRSDAEMRSGQISRQMYQYLMNADLVVCDLTTLNVNAVFELGVRMALRPKATVVIAAEETKIPFNLNQQRLFRYKHGGELIDFEDAEAAQKMLTSACLASVAGAEPDSLIYSLFNAELEPPRWRALVNAVPGAPPVTAPPPADPREFVWQAKREKDWPGLIARLRKMHDDAQAAKRAVEPYFTQQWALATYKQRETSASVDLNDLLEARVILERLDPRHSTDAETLGLWAAVHKRLSEHPKRDRDSQKQDLNVALASYQKGYILRQDHYNGANYAFLLLRRAVEFADADERRNVRDRVEASDTWLNIVALCGQELESPILGGDGSLAPEQRELMQDQFWRTASLALSLLALGNQARYEQARERLKSLETRLGDGWMVDTTNKQENSLRALLAKTATQVTS